MFAAYWTGGRGCVGGLVAVEEGRKFLVSLSIPSNSRTGRPGKERLSHGWRMRSGCVPFVIILQRDT